jgi:hypothetical protein
MQNGLLKIQPELPRSGAPYVRGSKLHEVGEPTETWINDTMRSDHPKLWAMYVYG